MPRTPNSPRRTPNSSYTGPLIGRSNLIQGASASGDQNLREGTKAPDTQRMVSVSLTFSLWRIRCSLLTRDIFSGESMQPISRSSFKLVSMAVHLTSRGVQAHDQVEVVDDGERAVTLICPSLRQHHSLMIHVHPCASSLARFQSPPTTCLLLPISNHNIWKGRML